MGLRPHQPSERIPELRAGTVEVVQRAFGNPEDAADRAISGMIEDDTRRKTGKGALERALDAEFEEMYVAHPSRLPAPERPARGDRPRVGGDPRRERPPDDRL